MLKRIIRTFVMEGDEATVDDGFARSQFRVVGETKSIGGLAVPGNTNNQRLAAMTIEVREDKDHPWRVVSDE